VANIFDNLATDGPIKTLIEENVDESLPGDLGKSPEVLRGSLGI